MRYWRPWRRLLLRVGGDSPPQWLLDYLYPDDAIIRFGGDGSICQENFEAIEPPRKLAELASPKYARKL